jgi:3-phenylpropionate/trans-cinnamate dioxygenase ferredoxin subunit
VSDLTTDNYKRVARFDELPQGKTLCVELDGREILLCHTAEGVYAVDNLCSHAKARLSEGKLKGQKILCPLHGAAFDVRNGSALTRPAITPIASHSIKLEGDVILIAVAD